MKGIDLLIGDWLNGKSMYPIIRRIFNLLFCISIASFFFEKKYFQYSWLDITDYKAILNFFIKGEFFVPLSIFIIVYTLTYFVPFSIFNIIVHFKNVKLERKILAYELNKPVIEETFEDINNVSKVILPVDITKNLILGLYKELRVHINDQTFIKINEELEKPKSIITENIILSFRALIAITIYFLSLKYFGFLLFTFVSVIIIAYMYFLLISYRLLDIIPTFIRKFHTEAEKYINENIGHLTETK